MTKKTTVINKHHKVPYDVYIGPGSKWNNPYSCRENTRIKYKVATKEEENEKYREYLNERPELLNSLHELKGKVLGCFCKPLPCHGDVLAELADQLPDDE